MMRVSMYILILFLLGMGLGSCRTTQYVPVETVRTETRYKDRLQRDSIHVKDSVFLFVKGDTVFRDRWRMEYKDRLVCDTVYIHQTDSIQVPYEVERKLSRWESVKMELGGWAFGVVILAALVFVVLIVRRVRRK